MPTYTYPPFPTYTDPVTFIVGLIEWILEVPLVAIANFLTGIAGAVTTAGQVDTYQIIGFIGQTWNNSLQSFNAFGVLAPIIASIIWGAGIVIIIFFVFKAIQLMVRETEEE